MNATTTSKTTVLSYTSLNRTARPFKIGRAPIGKSSSNRWFSSGSMRTNNARFKQSCRAASMELSAKPCREPATWLPRKKAEIWKVHSAIFWKSTSILQKTNPYPSKRKEKGKPIDSKLPAKVGAYVIIPRRVSCFFKRYVRFVEGNLKSIAWGWFVECFIFICFMKLRKFSATKWVLGGRCSSLLPPSLCRWLWCYSPLPCALIWMNKFNKTQTECDKSRITFSSWEYTASFSVHVTNYFTLHYIALHCIRLHCITWYYITSHCTTLHYITLNNTLHPDYIKSDHITWHAICIISHSRYAVHLKDPRSESSRRAW